MRVSYEATIDELIEVHIRAVERSKAASSWRNQAVAITVFISGAIAFIPLFIFFILLGWGVFALIVAFIGALVSAIISYSTYQDKLKQRFYTYFQEQYGERDTIPFELEFNESGITTKQLGVQSTYEWSNVEEIKETKTAVEFYLHGNGIIFVRKRAFNSELEEEQFVLKGRQYLNTSRNSSNWLLEVE